MNSNEVIETNFRIKWGRWGQEWVTPRVIREKGLRSLIDASKQIVQTYRGGFEDGRYWRECLPVLMWRMGERGMNAEELSVFIARAKDWGNNSRYFVERQRL